jgi:hypothetical protein
MKRLLRIILGESYEYALQRRRCFSLGDITQKRYNGFMSLFIKEAQDEM